VKAKVGDFGFALAPESVGGFLDRKVAAVVHGTPLQQLLQNQLRNGYWRSLMEDLLSVTIVALDRNRGLLAVDADRRFPTILDALEAAGVVNLSQDVILDPVYKDFFTGKLRTTLRAIGNPSVARNKPNPLVRRATDQATRGGPATAHTPCADYLWNLRAMAGAAVTRGLAAVRTTLGTVYDLRGVCSTRRSGRPGRMR
jgi:DNA replication ATP-dependent helicase Dna2